MRVITLGVGLCGVALWAQSPDVAKQAAEQKAGIVTAGQFGPIGIQGAMAGSIPTVKGAPYSADAVTERIQTLADGNRIVQTTSSSVARDSQGRVRRDESLAIGLPGSTGDTPKIEMIDDPVAGIHWMLDPQTKVASKDSPLVKTINGPALSPGASLPAPGAERMWVFSSGTPGGQVAIRTLDKRKAEEDAEVSHVDLGTQVMEGVKVQGTRITRTLPAGSVGNELPLVITTETWYSPDLQVLMMSKAEDPRMGVTAYRLTNVKRGEPDASLFQVPADYTIKDRSSGPFIYTQKLKDQ